MSFEIETLVDDISNKLKLLTPEGRIAWEDKKDMLEGELKNKHGDHYRKKYNLATKREMKEKGFGYFLGSEIRAMVQDAIEAKHEEAQKQKELEEHLKKILSSSDAEEHIRNLIDELNLAIPEMPPFVKMKFLNSN
jgi:hypothetical protein